MVLAVKPDRDTECVVVRLETKAEDWPYDVVSPYCICPVAASFVLQVNVAEEFVILVAEMEVRAGAVTSTTIGCEQIAVLPPFDPKHDQTLFVLVSAVSENVPAEQVFKVLEQIPDMGEGVDGVVGVAGVDI
jgi:hypothetical protein